MSDVSRFFELLYTQLLLRDLVAKVFPGCLVSLAVIFLVQGRPPDLPFYLRELNVHYPIWIVALFAYIWTFMVAILCQFVGMSVGLIRIHPWPPGDRFANWFAASDVQRSLRIARKFLSATRDLDTARLQRERFVVLKEATGNLGTALLLIAIILAIKLPVLVAIRLVAARPWENQLLVLFWVVSLLAAIGVVFLVAAVGVVLLCQNRYQADEQRIWEGLYTGVIQ